MHGESNGTITCDLVLIAFCSNRPHCFDKSRGLRHSCHVGMIIQYACLHSPNTRDTHFANTKMFQLHLQKHSSFLLLCISSYLVLVWRNGSCCELDTRGVGGNIPRLQYMAWRVPSPFMSPWVLVKAAYSFPRSAEQGAIIHTCQYIAFVVLLPSPLWPKRAVIWLPYMSNVIPHTATRTQPLFLNSWKSEAAPLWRGVIT